MHLIILACGQSSGAEQSGKKKKKNSANKFFGIGKFIFGFLCNKYEYYNLMMIRTSILDSIQLFLGTMYCFH